MCRRKPPALSPPMTDYRPDTNSLHAWLEGALPEEEARRVEAWLEENPEAAAELERMAGVAEFAQHLRGAAEGEAEPVRTAGLITKLKAGDFLPVPDTEAALALLDEPPRDGAPGRLGAFEIHRLLARGGMGVVFAGRDPALQRPVAVKVLSPRLMADAPARARFLEEARAVAALDHPDILPVHSVHEHGDTVFFVMPLVEGRTLAERVAAEGPLPAREAARIALHAARALAAAHARGLVHRDIKPANILLEHGRVRVVDFGIAGTAGSGGALSGTPEFMAPEQRAGAAITPASDLWSLGATLRCAAPDARGWLGRLITELQAEDPGQRPASAADVAAVLEKHTGAGAVLRRLRRAALFVVLLALAGLAATRIPFSADLLNRARLSPQQAFAVDGRWGVFATLEQALEMAGDGDVITIHAAGPWNLRQPRIARGHSVTLRAAEGVRPRFTATDDASGLICEGTLTLERLTFLRPDASGEARGLIEVDGGQLTLRRCELRVTGRQRRDADFPALVAVQGSAALRVERSALIGSFAAPVSVKGDTAASPSVTLRDSVLIGYPVVRLRCAEGNVLTLDAESCSLPSPVLFGDAPATPLPLVKAHVSRCVLSADGTLWWTPGESLSAVSRALHWSGSGNVFSAGTPFLTTAPRQALRRPHPEVPDLAGWNALEHVEESGARFLDAAALRRASPAWRGDRPVTDLTREEFFGLAVPLREQFPDAGANMADVWP